MGSRVLCWARRAVTVLFVVFSLPLQAEQNSATPYFQVLGEDPAQVERLPLLQTQADVQIAGTIAAVELRQVFENRGQVPIEAVYVFPASIRAAVTGLSMKVGERNVRGVIREKEAASAEYAAAKSAGRNTALLEQHAEGIFRMRLANIMPGDRIEVALQYTELLLPREGVYEFFLPTTFGADQGAPGGERAAGQHSSASAAVTDYSFGLALQLNGPLPIADIQSPSHHIEVQRPQPGRATVTFAADEAKAATRDFVLRFGYAGSEIAGGLLLYPGAQENFFLLTLQPPRSVLPEQVPAREYVFVVDVSGSMHGAPLDLAKIVMAELLAGMRAQDRFNVVLFAGGSEVLSAEGSLAGTPENLAKAKDFIDREGSGSTDLIQALGTAYALPPSPAMARSLVVVTDGVIGYDSAASRLIRAQLDKASVFAFGVGSSVDKGVIQRIARAGTGEALVIEDMAGGQEQARAFRRYIEQPLLTGLQASFEGFDAYDVSPMPLPDLFAQRPLVLIGKYRGPAQGQIRLRGNGGRGPYEAVVDVAGGSASPANAPLRALWARSVLADWLDFGNAKADADSEVAEEARKAEVTRLGLTYSLLTPHTSFVAVDDAVRTDQASTPVAQPTPQRASAAVASGGFGSSLLLGAPLQAALAQTGAAVSNPPLEVGGRRFARSAQGLVDADYVPGQPLLRIRRDSPAYLRLLQLRPDLKPWLELSGSVLLRLGRYAVLIDAGGFSDYPDRVLRRAATLRR